MFPMCFNLLCEKKRFMVFQRVLVKKLRCSKLKLLNKAKNVDKL